MRKTVLGLTTGVVIMMAACGNEADNNEPMNQSQVDARIDSLVSVRMQDVNEEAMNDLDRRMSIEVKVIADSIVQARMSSDADNTKRNNLPMP